MTCTSTQQHSASLYVEPGNSTPTYDASSERWEFVTETLTATGTLAESQGTTGTRFEHVNQTRKGTNTIGGDIVFEPSKTWFDLWLPRVLGAAESSDTFAVAETLPAFSVLVARGYDTVSFEIGYVNRLSLRGSVGQLVQATVNSMFHTRDTDTAPSVSISYSDAADQPYVFSDAALTLASTSFQFTDFELVFENNLIVRHNNSVNPTSICPGKARYLLRAKLDVNSSSIDAMRSVAVSGIDGVFSLTNGTVSTTFTYGKLVKPETEYSISQLGSQEWDIELIAKRNTSEAIVSVVNEEAA